MALRIPHDTLADQGQRTVGEGRQVTGAAQAAVLVDDGSDARVEHRDVGPHSGFADAGAASRQGRDPTQHQRALHLALHLRPGTGGVRLHQERCSCARRAVGIDLVACAPKPVETP